LSGEHNEQETKEMDRRGKQRFEFGARELVQGAAGERDQRLRQPQLGGVGVGVRVAGERRGGQRPGRRRHLRRRHAPCSGPGQRAVQVARVRTEIAGE